jgi:hypothetical protein
VLKLYQPIVAVSGNQADNITLKKRAARKPTLVSVAKQANKAKLPVARYEVKPDGTVVIVTGQPELNKKYSNEWEEDLYGGKH